MFIVQGRILFLEIAALVEKKHARFHFAAEVVAGTFANIDVLKLLNVTIGKIQRLDFDVSGTSNREDLDSIDSSPATHQHDEITISEINNGIVWCLHLPTRDASKARDHSARWATDQEQCNIVGSIETMASEMVSLLQ